MHFTLDDIRSTFDSGTFARGQAYARDGMVRSVALTDRGVEGEVAGSGRSVYHQSVRVTQGKKHIAIAGSCSCPMDYNCKHVVALLIEALKRQEDALPSPVAATGLRQGEVGITTLRWLDRLTRAQAAWAMEEAACTMGNIGWVLLPQARDGELLLYLCVIDFLADGTIAAARAVSAAQSLYDNPSVDLQRGDDALIRMYLGMRAGGMGETGVQPSGQLGFDLLCQLQDARKLWWAANQSAIKAGKLRPVIDGRPRQATYAVLPRKGIPLLSMQMAYDDGALPEHVIPTDPPMYLQRGVLGVLVLPPGAAMVPFGELRELMAEVPPIPAHEAADLSRMLLALGLGGLAPVVAPEDPLRQVDDWYADVSEEDEGRSAWFDLELGIVVDGVKHPLLPLLVQLIRKAPRDFDAAALARHPDKDKLIAMLPGGARVALPWGRIKPILATLGELYFTDREGKAFRLPYLDAARLAELEASAQMRWMGGERLREIGAKLHRFSGIDAVAAPAGLQAQLRDYQRAGLSWMQFLRAYGFGGILADDMGLGKTIQTLAHILVEKEAGRLDCPALVVAPTSLMANWQSEAARFAPGLRVLLLHGKDRAAQFDGIAAADLVLTTYALLPRDEETLRGQRFHLLILDESQYIKNHRAKAAQTARLIDARHRLCLTGTPLQNHLGELWSQFHFLMPGLLGDDKTFNAQYRKPIEKGGDGARAALLSRRVKPFMLRRTKDTVAKELPPKTEMMWPVELGSAQRDLYETVRLAMDKKVREEIDRKGVARSQIVILDALLKLRQVCCDPRLLKSTTASAAAVKTAGSAKFDALFELLGTLLSEGRRILVFSQFTSMLALIGAALDERGYRYALLTGDTQDRAAPVAAFQQGDVPLFLISLKAGGVGLNLTAADTVIHFDPWWNPASEDQATDRAWRIGQDKPVFVYKLIVKGSVEEKIQELQRKKSSLAHVLLGEGGALGQQVTADDLREIFG
jgi:superfamily II DNA or RNA helicase